MASGVVPPPPPGAWSMDATRQITKSGGAEPSRGDISDASSAWKHCKNVARDDGRTPDLYDLLSHSVRETQYSFPPQGWPSQVRMLSPIVSGMPAMVTDRYSACQTVAFCGAFPEIRRAWASVDNSLFLWRFDTWQDVPIEYSGEEQAIVSVGLAAPRPGVFVEAIRYLLVVCTTTEIVLLGVCCSSDNWEEITIQPLPLYSVPSDNIAMTSIATTANGRIFLGGADGNLYEIKYASADSWRSKRCSKICHSGGLRQFLPSFLPGILFGQPQALIDIVIDHQRHILYARTSTSAIHVYDLGQGEDDAPRHVAEISDFLAEASKAMSGRDVFGRGAGDKKGAAVILMVPIPMNESRRLQLLTVTADGRRVYWATTSSRSTTSSSSSSGQVVSPRPDRLRAEIARQAMPSPSSSVRVGGSAVQQQQHYHHMPGSRGLEISAACYASGALLLAEAVSGGDPKTNLFLLSRDSTVPPIGTATGAHVAVQGLRESIAQLKTVIPGEACAIRAVSSSALQRPLPLLLAATTPAASIRDELTTQNVIPAPRFVLVSTAGVVEVEKLRPADTLSQLLMAEPAGPNLELFFKSYGAAESAAMCIQLAAMGIGRGGGGRSQPAAVIANARAVLDNPRLCGEPALKDSDGATMHAPSEEPALGGGFDMGAVVPVAEPEWSGAHQGLCLYVARLLQPTWDELIVAPVRSSPSLLRCALSVDALLSLEETLRSLDAFLKDFISSRKARRRGGGGGYADHIAGGGAGGGAGDYFSSAGIATGGGPPASKRQRLEDAVRLELHRTEAIKALVARAADACFLLRALVEHNISRLSARAEDSVRNALRTLRFRDWIATEEGESVATQLIAVLVSEHLSAAGGLAEDLAAALQSGCPSYFKQSDRTYYDASGLLRKAETAATGADREAYTRDAVALLSKVPLACDLGQIVPQLALLRAFDAVVDLPIRKAAALDPANLAAGTDIEAETARSRREESCYSHVASVLRILLQPPSPVAPASGNPLDQFKASVKSAEREALKKDLLQCVASCSDAFLHECIYATLVDSNAISDILLMDTDLLEAYLAKASGLAETTTITGSPVGPLSLSQRTHADVLARYYIAKGEYAAAAGVYELLAFQAASITDPAEPSLKKRMTYLQAAVLQSRSCGDSSMVDRLETRLRLADVQSRLIPVLLDLLSSVSQMSALENRGEERGGGGEEEEEEEEEEWARRFNLAISKQECAAHVVQMQRSLYTLEELYNDVARPCHRWAECLELVDISSLSDIAYVSQLWDLYLKENWHRGWSSGGGGDAERCAAGVRYAAEAAAELGRKFYPGQGSFPVASVLLRLEQMTFGLWPVQSGVVIESESSVAYTSILNACHGSFDAVVRAYESLLSARSSDPHGEDVHLPQLRHRLLCSVRDVIVSGKEKAASGLKNGGGGGEQLHGASGRRELGVFVAACEAYAAEARKLPHGFEGEKLAEEFGVLGESVQGLMGYGGSALYA